MAPGTAIRLRIEKLRQLKNSSFFFPIVMGIYQGGSSFWQVFIQGKAWESLPSNPTNLLLSIFVMVGLLIAVAVSNLIDGMIILAEIEQDRIAREAEPPEDPNRVKLSDLGHLR